MSRQNNTTKDYDNILGALHVYEGLGEVQKYIETVDSVISQYKILNQEVQIALDEGRQVITNIAKTPSQKPERAVFTPTPKDNTTQQQLDRPQLGVQIVTLTKEVRQKISQDKNLNLSINVDKGVLIVKVGENSPAAKAGIKAGDVIVNINDKAVADVDEVLTEIGKYQVGAQLPLEINRGQQNFKRLVRLEAKPKTSNFKKEEDNKVTNNSLNNTPEETIVRYYQLINQRKYPDAWAILTRRFQRIEPDNNYNNYENWWESVESVKIDSIRLIEKNNGKAVVDAELKYLLKNGRQINDQSRITLILNSTGQWMINERRKL
ncbi:MAG: PDZ domain-containing protein [Nostocaceae cyanobacterium]|nr:PDZ domain-containing protein [Nostocaceae cyanobacterium]